MIIIKQYNEENIYIESNDIDDILENDINIDEIKEICIYSENSQIVNDFPFPDGDYKVKINHCYIETIPDNLPNTLKNLNFSYNNFRNIDLRNFTDLQKLKICNNKLIDIKLPSNLKQLIINDNRLANLSNIPDSIIFINVCNNLLVSPIENINTQCQVISDNNLFSTNYNFFADLPPIPNYNPDYLSPFLIPPNNFFIDIPLSSAEPFINNNIPTNSQENYQPLLSEDNNDNQNIIDLDNFLNFPIFEPISNSEEPDLEDNDILDDEEFKNNYKRKINKINELVESKKINIPDNFICPISKCIFYNPVILSDGHTYEKMHILEWLKYNNKSPMTNKILINKNISPNILIRGMVREWIDKIEKEYNIEYDIPFEDKIKKD